MPPATTIYNTSKEHRVVSSKMPDRRIKIKKSTTPQVLSRRNFQRELDSDIRISHKLRTPDTCDDEEHDATPKRKRFAHRKPPPRKETHIGDSNLALSGEEDSEELDCVDFSSDGKRSSDGDSSDDDDINATNGLLKKKKFYIVQNDGRPAELYRTDLIQRMRSGEDSSDDSDEDCGPGRGLLRLTDRWREEWSYGVQVPMNGKKLPVFCTESSELPPAKCSTFSMPNKYIGILPNSSKTSARYLQDDTHNIRECPRLRHYEGTKMDEVWLSLLNKSREHIPKDPLTMSIFLQIMDALEVDCYKNIHQMLLEPLHSPASHIDEVDEEAACDICRESEFDAEDEMVFCDGCNLCVHMTCYGLEQLPPDEWLCMKCALCYGKNPPCILCPTIGGAMKCTKKRQWAHIACALWIPECRFTDIEKREPITSIELIPDERWQLKCSICDTRQGACIQCSVKSCTTAFHVTCALRSGLEMRIEQDDEDDGVRMISLCPRHRTADIDEMDGTKEFNASDDEFGKEGKALSRLESNFYLYVDVDAISKRLSVDVLTVSDVYEYWKLKRFEMNGKPLIRNPQDEIVIDLDVPNLQLPSCGSHNSTFGKWRLTAGRLRTSLDSGRNLITLVVRREKKRQTKMELEWAMLSRVWEVINLPVPMSDRKTAGLQEVLESMMTADELSEAARRIDEVFVQKSPYGEQPSAKKTQAVENAGNSAKRRRVESITPKSSRKPNEKSPLKTRNPISTPTNTLKTGERRSSRLSR